MRKQIRSITCGCGNCATRAFVADTCPMWNSKEAIQLWYTDPSDTDTQIEDVGEQVLGIMEELMEAEL